ncbi:MAG: hypothetical protein ABI036_10375 [Fibrobacteria bacterium]
MRKNHILKLAGMLCIPAALWMGGCNTSDSVNSQAGNGVAVSNPKDAASLKGEIIPKGVEFAKPENNSDLVEYATSEGYYKGAAKDFHGFEKPLAKTSVDKSPLDNYIRGVTLVAGNSSVSCPYGYTRIDKDLNEGAHGQFVYLCYSTWEPGAATYYYITDMLTVTVNKSPDWKVHMPDNVNCFSAGQDFNCHYVWQPGYDKTQWNHNGDLNSGAGGQYIYLMRNQTQFYRYKQPAMEGNLLTGIGVISGASNVAVPSGWKKINVDLNATVGGSYVYFITHI